ncbi:hypothetical protein V6N13_142341 [Hibiscus sabdariffa]
MMSESRVRSSFGRRLERLGRPGLGYRNCLTIAVRTWNEVHGADGNGGCNVCAYFFLFLQVFARWGVLGDGCKWLQCKKAQSEEVRISGIKEAKRMGTLIKGSMEEYIEEEGLGKGGKWSFGERSTTADGKNKSGGHGKVEGKTRRGNEEEDDHVPGKRATYQVWGLTQIDFGNQKRTDGSKRQGIVYIEQDRKQNSVAGSETRAEERIVGPGKEVTIVDKGKATTSTGSRYRSPKRTLQGKIRFST